MGRYIEFEDAPNYHWDALHQPTIKTMTPPPEGLPPMTESLRASINYFAKGGHCEPVPLPEEDTKTEGDTPDYEFLHAELLTHHSEMIEQAAEELAESRAEVERLEEWKRQAMTLLADWDKVGEEAKKCGPMLLGSYIPEETLSRLIALREENKRLREWQLIETAPKDGFISCWSDWRKTPVTVDWDDETASWLDFHGHHHNPKWWRNIPAAPGDKGEGGEG